ncbi:hypothetical protein MC7420_3449 [Coleofasciculus chthonoplastes PCC 7420]|uniref:Uncharacterized protein n=1 Tax=Coleofasciculus chthonoplastes PCC 7420 TaxID=118168 RepID=B4W3D8_9CYAN|nr:hypothetical protein MC7420_3449 [Coleofasciculus chthonoplastes PCC 7420]
MLPQLPLPPLLTEQYCYVTRLLLAPTFPSQIAHLNPKRFRDIKSRLPPKSK